MGRIMLPVKPYLKRNMLRKDLHGHNTICSTIQEIFLMSNDEEVKFRCRIVMRMSKSMHNKLVEYKRMVKNGIIGPDPSQRGNFSG